MTEKTVVLSKEEVVSYMWDGAYGRHYLIVSPSGETRIAWADDNRAYDPWSPDDYLAIIPTLDPDGSGQESEDARDFLKMHMSADEFEEEEFEEGYIEYAEKRFPEEWKFDREEAANWLFDAFIGALNGWTDEIGDVWRDTPAPFVFVEG